MDATTTSTASSAPPRKPRRWRLAGGIAGFVALAAILPTVVIHNAQADGTSVLGRLDVMAERMNAALRGDGPVTRIESSGPDTRLRINWRGSIAFTDAEDDVQSLTGRLDVEDERNGIARRLVIEATPQGEPQRRYTVNGQAQALDEAGQVWLAKMVSTISQATTDPLVRAQKLLARGGMPAVLDDVDRAGDDHALRRRIVAAARAADALSGPELDRLLAASTRVKGDFERREALQGLITHSARGVRTAAAQPGRPDTSRLSDGQQIALLQAVAGMDGDFEQREVLGTLAPQLSDSPAVLQAWLATLKMVHGDFELRSVLQAQMRADPSPALLAAALQATLQLRGDFERREALADIATRMGAHGTTLSRAYAESARGIGGAFERREALLALLRRDGLDRASFDHVLDATQGLDANFELLQVLTAVAQRMPADADLLDRVRRAARSLGDFERGQLEKTLDRVSG